MSHLGLYAHKKHQVVTVFFSVAAQSMLAMALFPSQACSNVQSQVYTCSPLLSAPLMAKSVC